MCAAFLSDMHIGSKTFLHKEWNKFLKWLKEKNPVAEKIKYLVIPGDIVDGVGIYPNQENDLEIMDVYEQYELLGNQMEEIPDYISVIIQPGNHDAVRRAEPQPAFDKEIQDFFPSNFHFVGNPCYFSIHGVEVLAYHGQSIIDFSTKVPSYDQSRPTEIMKGMLQRRHLAPIYGGSTPLAPEKKDYMVIDRIPDIFVTGHVHVTSIDRYRGVTLINASTWQSQTDYQRMRNIVPDPGKLPIINLQNGNATIMDFMKLT
jgi:DNA polymerase II small subunit